MTTNIHQQDWAAKWAIYSPDKIAFKEHATGRTLTYSELNKLANKLAFYFTEEHKIGKGDRIAVLAENCLEYIVLFSVAQKTGCILVPLNYRLAPSEISYLLNDSTPSIIIFQSDFSDKIKNDESKLLPLNGLFDIYNNHDKIIKERNFPVTIVEENAPLFILYTSGTTGFPKGAIYSHKMLFWNSINTAMSLVVNAESRTVNCMPPFHTGGWNVLLTPFFHHGGYTCIMKNFDAKTVLNLLEKEKPTIFMGVPTMLKMIADEPAFANTDLSSLLYILVGGEPMPIPLIEKWHSKKVYIRQGYGMTEVGPNLTSLHQNDAVRKKGSIGRPNFYVDIKIIRENGQENQIGEPGELLLKGPMVTPGYWKNKNATDLAIIDEWFYSGDVAVMDEEGYLYIVDRKKNMFISGGENVFPAEVERIIRTHENVSEVAIISVPDERWGEVGKAFIVCHDSESFMEEEIQSYCRKNMASYKIPKYFQLINELPKNDTGKINRAILAKSI
ncbi:MAG: AMP-binding protein [Saprospiraceae bacterium]